MKEHKKDYNSKIFVLKNIFRDDQKQRKTGKSKYKKRIYWYKSGLPHPTGTEADKG